jgi:murein DD-endopeptidase MepM/ murein hydrolase activator NlpD
MRSAIAAACLLAGLLPVTAVAEEMPTLPPTTTVLTEPPPATTGQATTTPAPAAPPPLTTSAPRASAPTPTAKAKVPLSPARLPSCAEGRGLAVFSPGRPGYAIAPVARTRACAGAGSSLVAGSSTRVAVLRLLSVAAHGVTARAVPVPGGWTLRGRVVGLRVGTSSLRYQPTLDVRLGSWGRLLGTTQVGLLAAPLGLRLSESRGGFPAGTIILVGPVSGRGTFRPEPAIEPRVHGPMASIFPLPIQPELKGGPYTFPVAGDVGFGDTFGGPRSDVPGGWHHGADLFARLGQPVLAVADGAVYSVGWQRLGGWRLWLKDHQGNRFYYAHLSGYTKLARDRTKVRAGDVIGFIGHTGDAFSTPPHLHFEIHPASLLRLRYDGAVNPTAYLESWRRDPHPHVLPPAPLPVGASRYGQGALSDYRRLLALQPRPAARPAGASAASAAAAPLATGTVGSARSNARDDAPSHWPTALFAAAVALVLAAVAVRFRSARRSGVDEPERV